MVCFEADFSLLTPGRLNCVLNTISLYHRYKLDQIHYLLLDCPLVLISVIFQRFLLKQSLLLGSRFLCCRFIGSNGNMCWYVRSCLEAVLFCFTSAH